MASSVHARGGLQTASCTLFYEQEGNKDGPAILCIHGLGGTTNFYQPVASALQDYNLIRFDLSGHGRSSLPAGKTSIGSYVEDCEAVIKHFDVKDITVAGHSLGGLIALHLAAKRPELVRRLVLFGPVKTPPEAGQNGLKARAKTAREEGMGAVADTVISGSLSPTTLQTRTEVVGFARELLSRQQPEGYALACEALANSSDPEWDKIKAEVLIVGGADDKVSAAPTREAIAASLKQAKKVEKVTWEDVGHWLVLENPKGSAEVLKG